jgi:hypothetical protein
MEQVIGVDPAANTQDKTVVSINGLPLPEYQCHKHVSALKIAGITHKPNPDPASGNASCSYGAIITPADQGYVPFEVTAEYVTKHRPSEGGYYVVYDDGYESFSPAKAFEDGYHSIDPSEPIWTRDDQRTHDVLNLGGTFVSLLDISDWTDLQCQQAENWASAEYLYASDNDDVVRVARPDFLPKA